jgi:hypothetical protein
MVGPSSINVTGGFSLGSLPIIQQGQQSPVDNPVPAACRPAGRLDPCQARQSAALVRAVALASNAVVCSSVNVVGGGTNTDTPTST